MSADIPLGKNVDYPVQYDRSILFGISRAEGRANLGINTSPRFYGVDVWNGYELSWLEPSGKPRVAVLRLDIPASSPNIVESKSLKLYLNSLNHSQFSGLEQLTQTIAVDVSEVVGADVTVAIYSPEQWQELQISAPLGECIDDLPYAASEEQKLPRLLTSDDEKVVEETLYSNLMRSLCPVTAQPDWASVFFYYKGAPIDREALLAYVISYRQHDEFHEQCVERMFMDIQRLCKPVYLCIEARYMRRGGLDINPLRCSTDDFQAANIRGARQ